MAELDPDVEDVVPWSETITPYDETHFITYARLLDAEASKAEWQEAARIILHRDASADEELTYRCWNNHLQRAKWMTTSGYKHLLRK